MTDHRAAQSLLRYRYFRARGRTMDAVERLNEEMKAARKALFDFARSHGCNGFLCVGTFGPTSPLLGVTGGTPTTPGWRFSTRDGGWVPRVSTKEGKAIASQMRELPPMPNALRLMELLGNKDPKTMLVGHTFCNGAIELLCGETVISIPATADWTLPDAEPITAGEYLDLVERDAAERQDRDAAGGDEEQETDQ